MAKLHWQPLVLCEIHHSLFVSSSILATNECVYHVVRQTKLNHLLLQLSFNHEQLHSGAQNGPDGYTGLRMRCHCKRKEKKTHTMSDNADI